MDILKGVINSLYKISRITGKAASKMNTARTIMSGDPKKIAKHVARKQVYKTGNRLTKKVSGKIK